MSPVRASLVSLAAVVLSVPNAASAQLAPSTDGAALSSEIHPAASPAERLSPRVANSEWLAPVSAPSVLRLESLEDFMPVRQERRRNRAGIPLMVGGGVLFVAGAIIGGDAGTILMVGGAGAGAYGAYVYFGG